MIKQLILFWRYISRIGLKSDTPEYLRRKIVLANQLNFTVFINLVLQTPIILLVAGRQEFIVHLILVGSTIPYFILAYLQQHQLSRLYLIIIPPIVVLVILLELISAKEFLFPPLRLFILVAAVIPLIIFDLKEWKYSLPGVVLYVISYLGWPTFDQYYGPETTQIKELLTSEIFIVATTIVLFALPVAATIYQQNLTAQAEAKALRLLNQTRDLNEELTQTNEELQSTLERLNEKNLIIEQKSKDIIESIEYARRIQEALLPSNELFQSLLPKHFLYFQPRDIVSGDFYYLDSKLPPNDINHYVICALGDCTGHGVPGAFMSMLGINLLNDIVDTFPDLPPDEVLRRMDKGIQKSLRQRTDSMLTTQDGMDLAIGVWYPNQRLLRFASAGRPLYYWQACSNELKIIHANRVPVGGSQYENKLFETIDISLAVGSRIYLYSDGITDQFGGPKNRKFTPRRLQSVMFNTIALPLDEQGKAIIDTINQWKEGHEQFDDMTLVGIEL